MAARHSESQRTGSAKRDAERKVSTRFFHNVPADVDDLVTLAATAVPGTRSLHAVRPCASIGSFFSRRLGCGCLPCCRHDYAKCERTAWCGEWQLERVAPDLSATGKSAATRAAAHRRAALEDGGDDGADMPEVLLGSIVAGDVVAVAVPSTHERPFELLLVTEAPHVLTAPLTCHTLETAAGKPVVHEAGDVVIAGLWYQWLGASKPLEYELWDDVWAENKRDVPGFSMWEGGPTVVVAAADVVRRAVALEPVASRSSGRSQAKTIRRFKLHEDALEMLEEACAE